MKKKKILFVTIFILMAMIGTISGILFSYINKSPVLNVGNFQYIENSVILDDQDEFYLELQGKEKREMVSIERIPKHVSNAFIAIEDERFYKHNGVDPRGIARALVQNIQSKNMTGAGGSTITQQLIKLTHLTPKKTISRKVQEAYLAIKLERTMNKDEILKNYLNKVNFAYAYGIQAASQTYFRKDVEDLTIAQGAVLAAIPKAPSTYKPYIMEESQEETTKIATDSNGEVLYSPKNQERALLVIEKMKELELITSQEYIEAKNQLMHNNIGLKMPLTSNTYSYFADAVYQQVVQDLVKEYFSDLPKEEGREKAIDYLLSAGLTIYSTIDTGIQSSLEENFKRDQLFPSPSINAQKASKEKSKELGKEVVYKPEGAMVIIENSTGAVKGIVGGRDKEGNLSLDRAFSKFQPGSTTKPLTVYAPGFDSQKITPNTVYKDAPLQIGGRPIKNSGNSYSGSTTVREGLKKSKNVIAVQAWHDVGLETSVEYGEKFGLEFTKEDMYPAPLALGGYTHGQTPLAMASAYTTFGNQGMRNTPAFYTKVVDSTGKLILENNQKQIEVISKQTAYLITDILMDAVRGGTTSISVPNMEVAGKTGTTDNQMHAWFVGYTPYYTGAVWYGYDENQVVANGNTYHLNINVYGGSKPGPALMWEEVMGDIHEDLKSKDFPKVSIPSSMKSKPIKSKPRTQQKENLQAEENLETEEEETKEKEEVTNIEEEEQGKEEESQDKEAENQDKEPEEQPVDPAPEQESDSEEDSSKEDIPEKPESGKPESGEPQKEKGQDQDKDKEEVKDNS